MVQENNKSRKKQRAKLIFILSVVVMIILITSTLWIVHINRLRIEMEKDLNEAISYIEDGGYEAALTQAESAAILARRLRDNDAIDHIEAYILLIETVLRGNEFFDNSNYIRALETYLTVIDQALNINEHNATPTNGQGNESSNGPVDDNDLDMRLINQRIAITEMYIAFYAFIEQAESISPVVNHNTEALQYEDIISRCEKALFLYDEALSVATVLFFDEGVELAQTGIQEVNEQIFIAKHDEAARLFLQGDQLYNAGQYTPALEYFNSALLIYTDLDDMQSIIIINTKIDHAERMLAEAHQEETGIQEPPVDDSQDSLDENPDITSNYEHNLKIDFDLHTLINNQNQRPANQIRMGTRDGLNEGWYNGCGWIATYNALIILNNPKHPAEIVRDFESRGGTVLDGVFGTYPNTIESYLRDLGYNVNHSLFPQLSMDIDEAIKASRVSILAYAHTGAAHYIAIEYDESIDRFIVYNDSFSTNRSLSLGFQNDVTIGAAIDSFSALINNTSSILFSFSLITVN